jgi:hypothetical protein
VTTVITDTTMRVPNRRINTEAAGSASRDPTASARSTAPSSAALSCSALRICGMRPTQLANTTQVPKKATAVDRRAAVTRTDALLAGRAAGASFVITVQCLPSASTGVLARDRGVMVSSLVAHDALGPHAGKSNDTRSG